MPSVPEAKTSTDAEPEAWDWGKRGTASPGKLTSASATPISISVSSPVLAVFDGGLPPGPDDFKALFRIGVAGCIVDKFRTMGNLNLMEMGLIRNILEMDLIRTKSRNNFPNYTLDEIYYPITRKDAHKQANAHSHNCFILPVTVGFVPIRNQWCEEAK